ncbi:retrotransposon protein, putative, ty1-copia subclass [Tanacetum coccineum]
MVRSIMNLTTLPLSFWDYALETATRILNMVSTKKVDKTPYELWYGKVPNLSYLKKNLLSQEVSGRTEKLEEIQDKDTSPSENTNEIPMEVEGFEPPQDEFVPVHPTSNKWLDTMNAEMKSIKDNQVWCLVDLPPNDRLVAKGFTQTYWVDYEEMFSPITDIRAIMILIAITAFYDYEI